MPPIPELLACAGLSWRWALPADMNFVVSSWLKSSGAAFVKDGRCPWPKFQQTVDEARALGRTGLLESMWRREKLPLIREALKQAPALVIYDMETPSFILAWGHRDYRYTLQGFRKMGLARALSAALSIQTGLETNVNG